MGIVNRILNPRSYSLNPATKKPFVFKPGKKGVIELIYKAPYSTQKEVWWIDSKHKVEDRSGLFLRKVYPGFTLTVTGPLSEGIYILKFSKSVWDINRSKNYTPNNPREIFNVMYDSSKKQVDISDDQIEKSGQDLYKIFIDMVDSAVSHELLDGSA